MIYITYFGLAPAPEQFACFFFFFFHIYNPAIAYHVPSKLFGLFLVS